MQDRRTVKSPKFQLWVILSIVFFGFLGLSIPYLIFPSIFLNPAYTILPPTWSEAERGMFLGITLAAYPLGQFIGSPILGSLSDEYGRRKVNQPSHRRFLQPTYCLFSSWKTSLAAYYKPLFCWVNGGKLGNCTCYGDGY